MILILKSGASKKEIEVIEKKLYKGKVSGGFNAEKYNGVIKLKEDSLAIRLKLRNEWDLSKI